jgi:hypothetical protein
MHRSGLRPCEPAPSSPPGFHKIQHDGFRVVALKQGHHLMIWLPSDGCWNLYATWFSAATALKNEALSFGVRFRVA